MKLVLMGSSNSRRINFACEALLKQGITDFMLIPYNDVLSSKVDLSRVLPSGSCIRLDSPSESEELDVYLSGSGKLPRGIIFNHSTWFQNYSGLLNTIARVAESKNCCFINHPAAISTTFDKYKIKQLLGDHQISCSEVLGIIHNYHELRQLLDSCKVNRVFLKPRYGSSASGVLAYSGKDDRASVTTTVEFEHSGGVPVLYNSLKIKKYNTVSRIKILIDALGKSELIVEKWVPKNLLGNKAFDLRVFVVNRSVKHIIVRTSSSSITNLHLGNKRGDMESVSTAYPLVDFDKIRQTALDAVNHIPGLFYGGVDIILSGQKCKPYVVEVNGFGDMLLGDLYKGKTTYEIFAEEFRSVFLSNEGES